MARLIHSTRRLFSKGATLTRREQSVKFTPTTSNYTSNNQCVLSGSVLKLTSKSSIFCHINQFRTFGSCLLSRPYDVNLWHGTRMNYCTYRAVKLAYTDVYVGTGTPQDPPLIIMHGMFGSKRNWESLSRAISRKCNKRVFCLDLRNHGDSPHSGEMDYHVMSEDVQLFLQDHHIESSVVVGHSMGGKLAMALSLTQPELVSKMVVVDVSPQKIPLDLKKSQFPSYLLAMKDVRFDQTVSLTRMRSYANTQLEPVIQETAMRDFIIMNIEEIDGLFQWRVNLEGISDNLQYLVNFPYFEGKYEGDTLFIGGRLSPYIRESDYPYIKELFPKAEISHIDGAGHLVHTEKPNDFLDIFLKFLNRCR